MNVIEGMRRLGLVAGVMGFTAGTVSSYLQLQPLLAQRAHYNRFHSLASSAGVRTEIEFLRKDSVARHLGPWDKDLSIAPWLQPSGPWSRYISGTQSKKSPARAEPFDPDTFMAEQHEAQWIKYAEATALAGGAGGWRVDTGEVKAIYFERGTDEHVASRWAGHVSTDDISYFETNDGEIVNQSNRPSP